MGNCVPAGHKLQRKRDITLTVLGLDKAGKSTLLANLSKKPMDDILPTVGLNSCTINKGRYRIRLLDLGGGPNIRGIWHHYYAETHGVIFVLDASNQDRIDEAKEVILNTMKDERMRGKPLLLLANKQDQDEALDPEQLIDKLTLQEVLDEVRGEVRLPPTRVYACSTLKNVTDDKQDPRLKRAFLWLLGLVGREWEGLNERVSEQREAQRAEEEQARQERRRRREERERAEEEAARSAGKEEEEEEERVGENPFKPIKQVVQELTAAEEARKANMPHTEPTALPVAEESKNIAVTGTDSGVSLHTEEERAATETPEGEASSDGGRGAGGRGVDAGSSAASSQTQLPGAGTHDLKSSKQRKMQPGKLLHRLKHRNKTAPTSEGVLSPPASGPLPTALTNAPPLLAPWVSSDMVLEEGVMPGDLPGGKGGKGSRLPKISTSTEPTNQSDNLPLKGSNQSASGPFHLAEDVSVSEAVSTR